MTALRLVVCGLGHGPKHRAYMGGFDIAADCIVQADQGAPTGERQRYVAAIRERCGLARDRAFALVLNELERRADAGELGSTAA
ncbi:MAG TPA: hypothetical protein VF526_16540, partial [Solirubrobacteraceae bacterium]